MPHELSVSPKFTTPLTCIFAIVDLTFAKLPYQTDKEQHSILALYWFAYKVTVDGK